MGSPVQLSYSQCCVRKTSIVLMGLKGAFLTAKQVVENKQIIGNLSVFRYVEPSKNGWISFYALYWPLVDDTTPWI